MSKVKIISNPYIKQNEILIEVGTDWKPIIDKSALNNQKYKSGFFPFIVKDMLDILTTEIRDIECIVFEGTEDDYIILSDVIKENFSKIELIKENTYLNTANEILSNIKQIFENAHALIIDSVGDKEFKIKKDLEKFIDASNDRIPLCVIGNYSSGKSTFINALVGMDILPCGSKPLTQNICKIIKSKHKINSYIRFEYNSQRFEITFSNSDYEITCGDTSNLIIKEVVEELERLTKHSIEFHLNKALDVINKHNDMVTQVEIEMPFNGGILDDVNKSFVIFDTPGSDTATFVKHKEVLKNELKELTNGMLIFIVEKLDNDANEELFKVIKNIEELDIRFTIIVLNKADNEELPESGSFSEEEVEDIMSLSVPRNLYSNGIYYVSSILGLGSKIEDKFVSKFNKETYVKKKDDYTNKDSEFYKELYKYDIMPSHLKSKMLKDAELEKNTLFVNSGMYAIEHEILKFANEYSSYNKCKQSKMFFEKIIDITNDEIENNRKESTKEKEDMKKLLSQEITQLMHDVKEEKNKLFSYFREKYIQDMSNKSLLMQNNSKYNLNKMIEIEKKLRKEFEIEFGLQNEKINANNRKETASKQISDDWDKIKDSKGFEKLKQAPDLLAHSLNKFGTIVNNSFKEMGMQSKIGAKVSEELFEKIKKDYDENIKVYKGDICEFSKEYCEEKSKIIKENILKFINGSPTLNEKQKNSLSNVIANYNDISIDKDAESIFVKKELKKGPRILAGIINEYDSNKLSGRYNVAIAECIVEIYSKVQESHFASLEEWLECLINEINEQIVSLSPQLSNRAEKIKIIDNRIAKLVKNKEQLNEYFERINDLIEWKSL